MNILVVNTGSSSLKYQLYDTSEQAVLAKGLCERIGIGGCIKHTPSGKEKYQADIKMDNHLDAIKAVIDLLLSSEHGVIKNISEIDAVGHRVVHGAEDFASSVLITDAVIKALEDCTPLAPLHNPPNIVGINACKEVMGDIPQVGVFDTAFHQTMPKKAYIYPLPYEYYERHRLRRYGFHGTSHRYVSQRAAAMLGRPLEQLKLISCHLGNGSSISAIKYGKSVDTSMGFTPLAGLPMGTRSGDIDPGIIQFIMEKEGIGIDEMLNVLNKKSGVYGISGLSPDFRDLGEAAQAGNERAGLAIDVFNYSVSKRIGGYAAAMGGVDALIFTAGIGENSIELRESMVAGLEFMGLVLDKEKNNVRGKEADVSTDGSPARILVIPTDEELVIALDTAEIVSSLKK